MEKWNLKMPRNCKRKKSRLEDRFDEDMYYAICGQIIVIATQVS
jgi:hypothetical protein